MDIFLILYLIPLLSLFLLICKIIERKRNQSCYILDYQCYKPTDDRKLSTDLSGKIIMRNKNLGLNEYKFLLKVIVGSGIGEETYGPKMVFHGREDNPTYEDGTDEMDEFFDDCIGKLLARTGVSPQDIDVLVVNVACLTTSPSLASRIIKRYKMREDVKTYNLTGMGCSASLISVNIVESVFKCQKNVNALVVASESLSPNWYTGNDKSMILTNCLFRAGGVAILLTNKASLRDRAMFKLKCLVRTHHGARDEAYSSCIQMEDEHGRVGVNLSKNLPKAATRAFIDNLKVISPKILPMREIGRYAFLSFLRKMRTKSQKGPRPMIDFKTGVDHFCLHTGGKAVIDSIGKSLGLSEYDVEPARMTLHRFGNTSASSIWYVLGYMEAKKRFKKGDKVFMISLGAGFKCNSCLWEVVGDLDDGKGNCWNECDIDKYPPTSLANPFMDKYGWMNDKDESTFVLPEE
ncbi:3-ketoacyl-CoA synthase [Heracleum sosnowskyi]|uniref:3-ketoacyl-CoA synthase n=1 Tax=Heracleum sosnowskyi TaxID=360622 RepID=A0AAD8J290_9APIA|nr:3-ketoacyl-CoA synthase [Heracleum sosnowskyi]